MKEKYEGGGGVSGRKPRCQAISSLSLSRVYFICNRSVICIEITYLLQMLSTFAKIILPLLLLTK